MQDCFVFKDKVMQLAWEGEISLEKASVATNPIMMEEVISTCHITSTEEVVRKEDVEDALP